MAFTLTPVVTLDSAGNRRQSVVDITLDATAYVTGGYVLTPQQLGLGTAVVYGDVSTKTPTAVGTSGFLDCTNPAAPKLKVNAATAEVGSGLTTLTGIILEVTAVGY